MYKDSSPYYQGILATEGRYLSPEVVESILKDHSISLVEYLKDHISVVLPAQTDAAELLGWLGY